MFVMAGPRFTEAEAREAIAAATSWTGALRLLGLGTSGGNWRTLKKYAEIWGISTDHFDPYAGVMERLRKPKVPLKEILVRGSTYSRNKLKGRLYETGLKSPRCEMCGQGEVWRGEYMSLILDHMNGVRDDNRLENLQIVCPNCAATLDTHCGRANAGPPPLRSCLRCGELYRAKSRRQKFCSRYCGARGSGGSEGKGSPGVPRPETRKVERPPHDQLLDEVQRNGFLGTGRKFGVSDNAIRKWLLWYERERARQNDDVLPTLAEIRRRYSSRR